MISNRPEYFDDSDLRDIQVLISFNQEIIENVVKGDAIDFTQVRSIEDIESEDDFKRFAISTAAQNSLVNFQYSVFNNGTELNGSIELVDNNDIFSNFIRQSVALGEYFNLYVAWGYGKNRYHWSLVHKVLITDINYNLHEGHKIVNVHFAPIVEMRNNKSEISNVYTPIKKAKKLILDKTYRPTPVGQPRGELLDSKVKVRTRDREKEYIIADIIEYAAKACFANGLYGDAEVIIDTKDIRETLAKSNWEYKRASRIPSKTNVISIGGLSETDKFWQIFCSEIGCLDYQRNIAPSSFTSTTAPGAAGYPLNTILPKDSSLIDLEEDLLKDINAKIDVLKKEYYMLKKAYPGAQNLEKRNKLRKGYKQLIIEERDKLFNIYNNISYEDNYSIVSFYKPSGQPPIPYFTKFLKALNLRLGLNLKYAILDTTKRPQVVIGQDLSKLRNGLDVLASNTNKKLFSSKTGLRKIRSINPQGKTLLEDLYTGQLNLTYNDKNSIIEKTTVDINIAELFSWVNKVFSFDTLRISSEGSEYKYNLEDMVKLARVIKQYIENYSVEGKDLQNITNFFKKTLNLSVVKDQSYKKSEVVTTLDKELVENLEDFLVRNRARFCQAVAKDVISTEMKLVRVKVTFPGIPELDEINNLYYGRKVQLTVYDPSPTKEKTNLELISGTYFIEGFRHEILVGEGYKTYLSLFKSIDDNLFPEGDINDL